MTRERQHVPACYTSANVRLYLSREIVKKQSNTETTNEKMMQNAASEVANQFFIIPPLFLTIKFAKNSNNQSLAPIPTIRTKTLNTSLSN